MSVEAWNTRLTDHFEGLRKLRDKMNVGLKRQVFGQRAYRDYTYFNNILNGQGAQRGLSR